MHRFDPHNHSEYSNIRLVDAITKIDKIADRALKLGLSGFALTDHECLGGHVKANKLQQEIQKEHPDFKIALGNEIYLCADRNKKQKYYHFILIAKNLQGHRALRELSSRAWMCSFSDRGMERVVTTYSDLEEIYKKYPGSLIGTSACLGGLLSSSCVALTEAERVGNGAAAAEEKNKITDFMLWCKDLFGDDFYVECAPGASKEQIIANKRLQSVAAAFNTKMVIGCDTHYLTKEDRSVHKAYLNSKEGDREIDSFYAYSYLQDDDDIRTNLSYSYEEDFINQMYDNSIEIYDKIENYSLLHKQVIPQVEVKDYPKQKKMSGYPTLAKLYQSDNAIERYWVNECVDKLETLGLKNGEYCARLEEEARVKRVISNKLETNMFAYPVTLQKYVDLFWECGSIVGAGRGSSCSGLNHYLLGITQLDPVHWSLPFWRYLNDDRDEIGDIDLDLCPSKRPLILKKIKEQRGKNFAANIDNLSRQNLGCTLVATYMTEGSRSAVLTACRGYFTEEFPDGIDVDTAQYLSSLIPAERGNLWTLQEVIEGDPDKGRKKITRFIDEVNQYPGLLDIMLGIEGLIKSRSTHASGVIMYDSDPYQFSCFMRAPNGDISTQYDLHDAEATGQTKYDFLVTDICDKTREAIRLLQTDGLIDPDLSLREVYNKYLHPAVLPIEEKKYWDALNQEKVLNVFQFEGQEGRQGIKKVKPVSMTEMADTNGLIRLMTGEKGGEQPLDRYIRFKNNIQLWYDEMDEYGLTKDEQEALKPHFLKSHGVPPSQEQLMTMLMDERLCNFTLAEANSARKIVGKKLMSKIPALKAQVLTKAKSFNLGKYIWDRGVGPQVGYSFSIIHALAYSFIGFQSIYLATRWNPVYWNTACLIVNSGSLEQQEPEEEVVSLYEEEDNENYEYVDLPDRSGKKKIEKNANYEKVAKALGEIIQQGIKVSLVDINQSSYGFLPDAKNGQILFGLKALSGINSETIEKIIGGRPYYNLYDFMQRCPLNKPAMLSLIKGGAFDNLEKDLALELNITPRQLAMVMYLAKECGMKTRITLQNFNGLIERDLVPSELALQKQAFLFNKRLKTKKLRQYYCLQEQDVDFYQKNFDIEKLELVNGITCIQQAVWDKTYQSVMDCARVWIKENSAEILNALNQSIFKETWEKYALGNNSAWEMQSLCFYYGKHELANVDAEKYGIDNFAYLPEEPEVAYTFRRNGRDIPIFTTYKIIGTVIGKNDNKSSVSILTTTGVVTVKFTREYYAMYAKQISERQADGTKKIVDKSWFKRGTKIMVTGYRRNDEFVAKTYKATATHQLYKIETKNNGRDLVLIHDRPGA